MKLDRILRFACFGPRISHAKAILRSAINHQSVIHSSNRHLEETINWLCSAQDKGKGGVSLGYSLLEGWLDPYPETTGYIIPTLYNMAARYGRTDLRERARRLAEWEIEIQMPCGAVQAGSYNSRKEQSPAVFNTGQVIFGWLRAYEEEGEEEFLKAAVRAADWLIADQDSDGCWRRSLSKETATSEQVYNIRCAWALLKLHQHTRSKNLRIAALKNISWTLKQQTDNGWFRNNSFFPKWNPFTHNFGYVMEGLIGCGEELSDERLINAARTTAQKLLEIAEQQQTLHGDYDEHWRPRPNVRPYVCLTGNAQIAGVWLKFYKYDGNKRWRHGAELLLDEIKRNQILNSANEGIRGGIAGSSPVYGFYTPFIYINWGAKFFLDALADHIDLTYKHAPEQQRIEVLNNHNNNRVLSFISATSAIQFFT